jgi:hypothetical protein
MSSALESDAVAGRPQVGDLDRSALDRLGIRYTYRPELPLSELDEEASRAAWNQARLGDPVDEEHVEELVAELERDVELPPVIFYRDDGGRAVTLSGNHRRRAYERIGQEVIPAYEATGLQGLRKEDERVLRLIYEANHGHGKAVSIDDRVHQALVLIENGYNVRAAATAVGIPENRVRDQYDAARATQRLEMDLRVDTSAIPISAQRRIVNIKNDRVASAVAQLVPRMDKKTQEVNQLVKAVNSERTEEAQLAVVQDYEAALTSRSSSESSAKRRSDDDLGPELRKLDNAIGTILRFDVEVLRSGISREIRDHLLDRVHRAAEKLAAAEHVL